MLKAEYEASVLDCDSFVVIIFVLSKGFWFFVRCCYFMAKNQLFRIICLSHLQGPKVIQEKTGLPWFPEDETEKLFRNVGFLP
jgi:hypothetical protein